MKYGKKEAKQYARENLHGLWGSIPYAFHKDLELNEKGLVSDLRHLIDVIGIEGFYMGGIVNEFWSLTVEERKRAQEILIREAAGSVMTTTMTGHTCIKTAVELTKHAEKLGADFVTIMNPYYGVGSPEMVFEYFRAIAEQVEIGIMILNSSTAKYVLSPHDIARLAEIDNICAVKNDPGFDHTNQVRRLIGDRIVVADPKEENWLPNMYFEGQQVLLATSRLQLYQWKGFLPVLNYTKLALKGDFEAAKKVSATLEPLRNVAKKWLGESPSKGGFPIARQKYWQELLGMTKSFVRPLLLEMSQKEKEEMRKDLEKAGMPLAG